MRPGELLATRRVHITGTKAKSVHHPTQHNLGTHTDCVPIKCISFKCNGDVYMNHDKCLQSKRNEVYKRKVGMQESPIKITNRFQVLASNEIYCR